MLITGAGSGIRQKMAVKFAELGATVVGWDINEIGLQQTRELIRAQMGEDDGGNDNSSTTHDNVISAAGAAFHSRVVDITDREAVCKAACTLVQTAGGPCQHSSEQRGNRVRQQIRRKQKRHSHREDIPGKRHRALLAHQSLLATNDRAAIRTHCHHSQCSRRTQRHWKTDRLLCQQVCSGRSG